MTKVKPPTNFDVIESLNFIWDKLHRYTNLAKFDAEECDDSVGLSLIEPEWDEICTAMSWIEDECGVERIEGILEYKKGRVENE